MLFEATSQPFFLGRISGKFPNATDGPDSGWIGWLLYKDDGPHVGVARDDLHCCSCVVWLRECHDLFTVYSFMSDPF